MILFEEGLQQTASGTVIGGVAGRGNSPPGGSPYEDEYGNPVLGRVKPAPTPMPDPILAALTLIALKLASNVSTNRYKDNKKNDEHNCTLYPFSEKKKQCPDGESHHIVPDRAWRSPGTRGTTNTGIDAIDDTVDDVLQKVLPWRQGGYYYGQRMNEEKGYCICVTSKEHKLIHYTYQNPSEKLLGSTNNPQWTAKLKDMEAVGAASVSAVTGCDKIKIQADLRKYHEGLELDENTMVRADPSGRSGLTMEKFGDLITNRPIAAPR